MTPKITKFQILANIRSSAAEYVTKCETKVERRKFKLKSAEDELKSAIDKLDQATKRFEDSINAKDS